MNIVIINRRIYGWNWNSPHTNYRAVIDHKKHRVSYVVDPASLQGLHADEIAAADVTTVASLNDSEAIKQAVRRLHAEGAIDRIIALNEDDLLVAAELRAELAIAGDRPENVQRFRNKVLMKQILQQQGIAIPAFTTADKVEQIVAEYGFPVVLKPVDGVCSKGVKIPADRQALTAALAEIGPQIAGYEAEQFIAGDIYHLDGMMADGDLAFCQVYQYYNSCYAFANGTPVGVMMVDSAACQQKLTRFAATALNALGLQRGSFHLELFIDTAGEVRFLEVGARVGGAFVAPCVEKRWGISLFEENLRLQLNDEVDSARLRQAQPNNRLYGWLLFPVPDRADCYVKSIHWPNPSQTPGILDVMLPVVGKRIDQSGGYIHTAGTFLLEAETQDQQRRTIEHIISQYRVEYYQAIDIDTF